MNLYKIFNIKAINLHFRFNKLLINNFGNKAAQYNGNRNKIYTIKREIGISSFLFEDKIIKTPPFAESVTEGDVRWSKKPGDTVIVDEVIGEIETDKTAIPIHSPFQGTILELLVADGNKVIANQDLIKISLGTVVNEIKIEKKPEKIIETKEKTFPNSPELKNDKLIKEIFPPPQLRISLPDSNISCSDRISGSRNEQRIKMNRMRIRIAERLKSAQNTCAMLTTFNECDMSRIIDIRKKYQEDFQRKHGVKLGFMSAFLKGAALALQDQPVVNAVIEGTDIIYRDYIDISVAVATPKGLVVPVLRDVHVMGFADIEKSIFQLGERARLGQLAIEDMDGGTFTISNGGVFGSLMGTPIINPPQSAILGIHATQQRPVVIDGKIEIRPMMYLALTYDHRLIDGREAVLFLRKIKSFIEDPCVVLLNL